MKKCEDWTIYVSYSGKRFEIWVLLTNLRDLTKVLIQGLAVRSTVSSKWKLLITSLQSNLSFHHQNSLFPILKKWFFKCIDQFSWWNRSHKAQMRSFFVFYFQIRYHPGLFEYFMLYSRYIICFTSISTRLVCCISSKKRNKKLMQFRDNELSVQCNVTYYLQIHLQPLNVHRSVTVIVMSILMVI